MSSRVAPNAPRTHEVVVSLAENEGESPTVATKIASGVCREYDAREERMGVEACSLVMESLEKRLSQITHRMAVFENKILDQNRQVHIRRHDDTGLADCTASTPRADPLPLDPRRAGGARLHAQMSKSEHDLNGALPEGPASSGCYVGIREALDTSRKVA